MTEQRVEPAEVIDLVEDYVRRALNSAEQYSNSQPLDESGVYDLHRLAARVYAMGWAAGETAQQRRDSAARVRQRLNEPVPTTREEPPR